MTAAATAAGLLTDRMLGEPPTPFHPVAWFGRAMTAVERVSYRDHRVAGVVHVGVGLALAGAAGAALTRLVGRPTATAVAVTVCAAGRMLDDEAAGVGARLRDGDLDGARTALRSLVGRTVADLPAPDVVRAVIESVAENSVDAVTATALWGAVGGAPGAFMHRAVNTLDAMVGHHSPRYEHFGWAAARLDDVVNWVPARVGAVIVLLPSARRWEQLRTAGVQARAHPSPNGGLIEAAFAHRLGVTLGGANRYGERVEDRGHLGAGPPPQVDDIGHAIALRRRATHQLTAALVIVAALRRAGRVRRQRP